MPCFPEVLQTSQLQLKSAGMQLLSVLDLFKLLLTFPCALSPTICPSQLSVGWT